MTDAKKAPLEDVMAAMDVVDTLRHQQGVAVRELDGEARRDRLLQRLKGMYQAQGIDVPEQVLLEGIDALEEERFSYKPVEASWQTRIAHLWVNRKRWGRPVGLLTVFAGVLWGIYFVLEVVPANQFKEKFPAQVNKMLTQVQQRAKTPEANEQAELIADRARNAWQKDDVSEGETQLAALAEVRDHLLREYTVRVISRANQSSGVWRTPPGNSQARNYYLIVEAIDSDNQVLELEITSEENNKTVRKKTWGLRVNEQIFYEIASDKKDDGIIQGNKVGVKRAGYLRPEFSVPTTGATITEW